MHPERALHRRIVLTGRLPFGNCEKCGQLTVEPAPRQMHAQLLHQLALAGDAI